MLLTQRLVTSLLPVASRLWHFGTKNSRASMRYASRPRASSSAEERELDKALASRAVSAPFFVKGTQRLREPLKLFLTGPNAKADNGSSAVNNAKCIEFGADGLQEGALQALIQAAEPAPFGLDFESVLDPTYRDALQIKAGSFGLSASLPTAQMLHDISILMQPAAPQIFAQLHNINVYGPGGMFKSHADTPTCAAQFGSLVVALPYKFEGGELVVRHMGKSVTLTLGGGGDGGVSADGSGGSGGPLLHYAAFFSDCIHEVLPVHSGHRVTLTFNLLLAESGEKCVVWPLADEGSIPVVAKLRELLAQPTWHPQGCTLGYVMQHRYATSLSDLDNSMFPRVLKGDDRLLHAALCGELGLQGKVRPLHFAKATSWDEWVWEDKEYDDEGNIVKYDYLDYVFIGNDFKRDGESISDYRLHSEMTTRWYMRTSYKKAKDAAAVWIGLRDGGFNLHTDCKAWGNQPVTATIYSGVALLLKVPAWGTPERERAMATAV